MAGTLGEVFDEAEQDDDDEREEEAEEKPDVDEFDVRGWRQLGGHGLVERVHDQHGGDGHGHAGLEMLLMEVYGRLGKHVNIFM